MTTYDNLRSFVDSWGLLSMSVVFLILCLWPFRKGGRAECQEAATSIFTEDDDGRA